jgi:hypothetical protein
MVNGYADDMQQQLAYVRFLMERGSGSFFNVLQTSVVDFRKRDRCATIDISSAEGVASMFRANLSSITSTDVEQNYFVRHTPISRDEQGIVLHHNALDGSGKPRSGHANGGRNSETCNNVEEESN